MTISERIFELLEQRGMSQKEFSEKTGIAQSSISDWMYISDNKTSSHARIDHPSRENRSPSTEE